MAETFNPYQKWLGLSPKTESPNHFQLLQVRPTLSEEREIQRAVEMGVQRCLELLARVPPNQHLEIQKRLRSEIETARQTLLDPKQRKQYVEALVEKKQNGKSKSKASADQPKRTQPNSDRPFSLTDANPPARSKPPAKTQPKTGDPSQRSSQTVATGKAKPDEMLPPGANASPPTAKRPVQSKKAQSSRTAKQDHPVDPMMPQGMSKKKAPSKPQPAEDTPNKRDTPPNATIPVATAVASDSDSIPTAQPIDNAVVATAAAAVESPVFVEADPPAAVADAIDNKLDDAPKAVIKPVRKKRRGRVLERVSQILIVGMLLGGIYLIYANLEVLQKLAGVEPETPIAQPETPLNNQPANPSTTNPSTTTPEATSPSDNKPKETQPDTTLTEPTGQPSTDPETKDDPSTPETTTPSSDLDDDPPVAPPEPMPPVVLNDSQLRHLDRQLLSATRCLYRREKSTAAERLDAAKSLIESAIGDDGKLTENQLSILQRIESIEKVAQTLDQFWRRVIQSSQAVVGNRQLDIRGQMLGFVEADENSVTLRNAGTNIRYEYFYLPPALAVELVATGDIDNTVLWSRELASFYAVNSQVEGQFQNKIEQLIRVAEDGNADCQFINDYLEHKFAKTSTKSSDEILEPQELLKKVPDWIVELRKKFDYRSSKTIPLQDAAKVAQALWDYPTETVEDELVLLHELLPISIRSGNASLVEDVVLEMHQIASVDSGRLLENAIAKMLTTKMTKFQKRVLYERAIAFFAGSVRVSIESEPSVSLLGKLSKQASLDNLPDVVRRLSQLSSNNQP
ncbi:MAG: hypothetical protein AAFN77_01690 [Planctomycetota bacterium]